MRCQSAPSPQPCPCGMRAPPTCMSERRAGWPPVMALSKSHVVVALEEQANPLWAQRKQGSTLTSLDRLGDQMVRPTRPQKCERNASRKSRHRPAPTTELGFVHRHHTAGTRVGCLARHRFPPVLLRCCRFVNLSPVHLTLTFDLQQIPQAPTCAPRRATSFLFASAVCFPRSATRLIFSRTNKDCKLPFYEG